MVNVTSVLDVFSHVLPRPRHISMYTHTLFPLYLRECLSMHHNFHFICGAMDQDTPRLPALLTKPANNAPANNADNARSDNTNASTADDHFAQPKHTTIAAGLRTASDSSSKPQRRRNKPSLSCETCTVSRNYAAFASSLFFHHMMKTMITARS